MDANGILARLLNLEKRDDHRSVELDEIFNRLRKVEQDVAVMRHDVRQIKEGQEELRRAFRSLQFASYGVIAAFIGVAITIATTLG